MKMRSLGFLVLLFAVSTASRTVADAIPAQAQRPPAHRVVVTDRAVLEGRTLVSVGTNRFSHGDGEPTSGYALVDDFALQDPARLCAVPSAWVIDSPLGPLGPRMLRGARAASGAVTQGADAVRELEALFESDEVACVGVGQVELDATTRARGVEAVEDTVRVHGAVGRVLQIDLVSVGFQLEDHTTIVVPAPAGGGRPGLRAAPRSSFLGCRAAPAAAGHTGFGLALAVMLVFRARSRRRRSR